MESVETRPEGGISVERNCQTCQHRNSHGVCTNADSVFFGSRVDDGACPVWENYGEEMRGISDELR